MTARALTEEAVVEVLTSHQPLRAMARKYNTHLWTLQRIRRGESYKAVRPDIPRPDTAIPPTPGVSCEDCVHHARGQCTLGFPEGKNIYFARRCSAYHTTNELVLQS